MKIFIAFLYGILNVCFFWLAFQRLTSQDWLWAVLMTIFGILNAYQFFTLLYPSRR